MKIAFFGTPEHSAKLLSKLLEVPSLQVQFVVTNPDRPKGRSKSNVPSPVKELAISKGLPVFQYESIRKEKEKALQDFSTFETEMFVVFAYGSILPAEVFRSPKFGTINLHGSLLPDLRGASPVQTALWRGYKTTGVSIQYISEGMDEGDIIREAEVPILPEDDSASLMEKITDVGTSALLELFREERSTPFAAIPQNSTKATYCTKIRPEDRVLDLQLPAEEIQNRIRALSPEPGAICRFREKRVVLYRTKLTEQSSETIQPGKLKRMDKKGLLFQCGDGRFLEVISIQPESKNRMTASDFMNGYRITDEDQFE
ncbi:methionyl-tRNA formyltransferase [Leptospira perolatii]|uniref:Methionyl-tRNA formyltransferase n=1 Tax=Leptospira perolatii TaxID=2023191 RepID=A0A2M9ZJ53_9LEPT|nr:methionyl-tRNA formyltransferase [Leptospira perolatii]PJZ69537.1 methionyl-tRNA formyltransferase [Leptospira perolatii]PJZ72052.1 methionyl-tRNA formyltransferase [Leptospira perolatii]